MGGGGGGETSSGFLLPPTSGLGWETLLSHLSERCLWGLSSGKTRDMKSLIRMLTLGLITVSASGLFHPTIGLRELVVI